MESSDWRVLAVLAVFLALGSLGPRHRRGRVILLVTVFLGMYLYPWIRGHSWDWAPPFRYYSLYSLPAPDAYSYVEVVMVGDDRAEYPVDFRVWQPLIPRVFNTALWEATRVRRTPAERQSLAAIMLTRVTEALAVFHQLGAFPGWDSYLLGPLHLPQHQSAAVLWKPGAALPLPEEVKAIRLYHIRHRAVLRRQDESSFDRKVLFEYSP